MALHPACRTNGRSRSLTWAIAAFFTCTAIVTGCEDASSVSRDEPRRDPVLVQAASSLRDLLPTLVETYEAAHPGVDINPRYAGSQTLARQIDAGVEVDVFLSADESVLALMTRQPDNQFTWISNDLVVIAPADSDIEYDDLLLGDGPVAIAAEAVPLGRYTRLALRMKEIWRPVEARATQFTSASAVLAQVAAGAFDLGVVYATDAALEPDRVRIVESLPLPESVDIVYSAAAFTDKGDEFIAWLRSPEAMQIASDAGFTPPRPRPTGASAESGT